jgi:hypothetical protein
MELHNTSDYYTYKSFVDKPLPVNDFNKIKFFEAEISDKKYPNLSIIQNNDISSLVFTIKSKLCLLSGVTRYE